LLRKDCLLLRWSTLSRRERKINPLQYETKTTTTVSKTDQQDNKFVEYEKTQHLNIFGFCSNKGKKHYCQAPCNDSFDMVEVVVLVYSSTDIHPMITEAKTVRHPTPSIFVALLRFVARLVYTCTTSSVTLIPSDQCIQSFPRRCVVDFFCRSPWLLLQLT
jgi:hypothetical protein